MKKRIAFFPGSFDPFTKGHADIVSRGLKLFDEIIIGIGTNSAKKRYFELDFMERSIQKAFSGDPRIKVVQYDDLTATVARQHGADFILRGLRNTTDFEYENTISDHISRICSYQLHDRKRVTSVWSRYHRLSSLFSALSRWYFAQIH